MKYDEKLGSGFVIVVIITVTIFTGCVEESPMSTPTPTAMPPIENGKGRIVFNYKILPEKVIIREIKDDFLLGVGTVDNKSSVSSTVLKDLRINGVNYFLPSITWPAIEVREGYYYGTPRPGMESITWLDKSGAVLNGHCFLFFMNDEGMVPSFAFNRSFEEQKK